ncbi:MAG TPA: 23S rRNA (adenine(2503)-C(2))-methyltransferase RlmN [Rhodospirillaceae bacterium]|nr:23S rRNA (adenine(2503)-C(2))-methyltransferase RlmN [Rhodospirillaceae bacterium]
MTSTISTDNILGHAARFEPAETLIDGKRNLVGLTLDELKAEMAALGLEAFRAKQLWTAIYCHGLTDFNTMTTLAKPAREKIAAHFVVGRPTVSAAPISVDGSRKWLLAMPDGHEVEAVYIPEEDRGALCVSCQVGCTNKCSFCHTGTMRLVRNLDASEIIMQVMLARDVLNEWKIPDLEKRMLSNIVLMGMGEPLFNYANGAKALKIIMDEGGIAIGKRRITLSTSGVVPMIRRCGEELGVNLAISLHAVTDEVRDVLIPLNKKYPIAELIQACRDYPASSNARRITFEYVMLKGVNDSPADARALVKLLEGIPAKINLLPYNPWPGSPYECSDDVVIQKFGDIVNRAGYATPIRTPRGRDIMAACGQLKSASVKERATKERDE